MSLPILYSFRRCPYAMRARMALWVSGTQVELREIELKRKPAAMLQVSPKGTVPVLQLADGQVIDESLEIMAWALARHDPEGWLLVGAAAEQTLALLQQNDGEFKRALDQYKYAAQGQPEARVQARAAGEAFLARLETLLQNHGCLLGAQRTLADIAIFPFVRQFVAVDAAWFAKSAYQAVGAWLEQMTTAPLFSEIMQRAAVWQDER